jgi:hypothetical protein
MQIDGEKYSMYKKGKTNEEDEHVGQTSSAGKSIAEHSTNTDKDVISLHKDILNPDTDVINPDKDVINPEKDVINPDKDVIHPEEDVINPYKDVINPEEDVIEYSTDIVKDVIEHSTTKMDKDIITEDEASENSQDSKMMEENNNVIM